MVEYARPEGEELEQLAKAIVARISTQRTWTARRIAEILGEPQPQPNVGFEYALNSLVAPLYARLIQDPASLQQVGTEMLEIENRNRNKPQDEISPDISEALKIAQSAVDEGMHERRVREMENYLKRALKTTEQAIILAREKGVNPAFVYENDELYAQVIRRSFSPDDFAREILDQDEKSADEEVIDIHAGSILEAQGFFIFDQEMVKAARETFYTADLRENVRKIKDVRKRIVVERLKFYWGDDIIATLPQDLQDSLLLTQSQ